MLFLLVGNQEPHHSWDTLTISAIPNIPFNQIKLLWYYHIFSDICSFLSIFVRDLEEEKEISCGFFSACIPNMRNQPTELH